MFLSMNYKEEYPEYNEARGLFVDIIKNTNCHDIAEKNNFISTGQALFYLSFQINRICDSILLRFIGDYAIVILYRSIMEHFIKHYYISLRFHEERNDDVGKQYYFDCIYDEQVKKINAVLWPNFFQVKPNMKHRHKQIKNNAEFFTLRKILNYIGKIDLSNISEPGMNMKRLIQEVKKEYSLSSSYTHGGPEAISMATKVSKKHIQHSAVCYSILGQLNTIRIFSGFDSPNKGRLTEVRERMEDILKIYLENWPAKNESE